jgi:hypothetical protein
MQSDSELRELLKRLRSVAVLGIKNRRPIGDAA